jgi:membrane fusion protein (multidrug efflux system)
MTQQASAVPEIVNETTRIRTSEQSPPSGRRLDARQHGARNSFPSDNEPKQSGRRRKKKIRMAAIGILLLAAISAGGWYGWRWYTVSRFLVETDDAYTQADNIPVSSQVAGYITEVMVADNQHVKRGEVIARIDDRLYRAAVAQARATLDVKTADAHNIGAQIARQASVIAQMKADVDSAKAELQFAAQEQIRYAKLMQTGAGTIQKAQQTSADRRMHEAKLAKFNASLEASRKDLRVLQTREEQAKAAIENAKAALSLAQINLGYATITAPHDGVVGDRTLRVGQLVQPGTRLLTLVPMHDVYVIANYKETQLEYLRRGQRVELSVDGYPDLILQGHVDSLAPGSGAQFALLPPENATGNFTKIVQRVPVKILLDHDDPATETLRPGLSVISAINVRSAKREARYTRQAAYPAHQSDEE